MQSIILRRELAARELEEGSLVCPQRRACLWGVRGRQPSPFGRHRQSGMDQESHTPTGPAGEGSSRISDQTGSLDVC